MRLGTICIGHPECRRRGAVRWAMTRLFTPVLLAFAFMAGGANAEVNERTLKLGYGIPEEHPLGQGVNKFIEIIEEKSGGKIKITPYPATQLGSESQMIAAVRGGIQEMVIPSSAPLTGFVPEYALFDFPFLFRNEKEAHAVLDGPVGERMLDVLSQHGLKGLCFWENGFRVVTNNKRPITKAEDIKGLKIRTMQSPVYLDVFNTLGANAVPMAFTELFTALETGAVDAQENPYAIIDAGKFDEVQKYVSATKHSYAPFPVMIGKKLWDQFTPDEQKIFEEACTEAQAHQRKISYERNTALVKELQEKGMQFNELAPEELARMREMLAPVAEKYTKQVGEDLVRQTYAELEKIRTQQ